MSTTGTTGSERRRGGHAARAADRATAAAVDVVQPQRRIPTYELLDADALDRLEAHADWILDEVGVDVRGDEEALELFRSAGARLEGERVRFDPGLVRHLCASAPAAFQMHGRDPRHTVTVGGDHVVFSPAYGSPFVSDLDGGRRYATLVDFQNFVKLTYASPWLHHSGGTVCEPVDVPVNKRHLDMVYAHLRWSTKPFMGGVTSAERAEDSVAMARVAFGADRLERDCVIQGNINVNSPLVFDEVMTGALKAYARANQGNVISPFIIGGAMGPVTQPALIAQAHAETMVGIALAQLVRPGSPVVYGSFLTTMDLRSGAPTFGTPEAVLATYAMGQLARRLGLPLRCGGHYTASKTADAQAMLESADAMGAAVLSGANFVHQSAGWLEGGLVMGYEKFVMDTDHLGMLVRRMQGLVVDDDSLAADGFLEAGPGMAHLGTAHTMGHFATANFDSALADTNSFEQWTEDGAMDMAQRANVQWKQALADYQPPPIDPSVDADLQAFIAERKDSMPDMWY